MFRKSHRVIEKSSPITRSCSSVWLSGALIACTCQTASGHATRGWVLDSQASLEYNDQNVYLEGHFMVIAHSKAGFVFVAVYGTEI